MPVWQTTKEKVMLKLPDELKGLFIGTDKPIVRTVYDGINGYLKRCYYDRHPANNMYYTIQTPKDPNGPFTGGDFVECTGMLLDFDRKVKNAHPANEAELEAMWEEISPIVRYIGYTPNYTICTGNGFQLYWRHTAVEPQEGTEAQLALIKTIQNVFPNCKVSELDPTSARISSKARVPYTLNRKVGYTEVPEEGRVFRTSYVVGTMHTGIIPASSFYTQRGGEVSVPSYWPTNELSIETCLNGLGKFDELFPNRGYITIGAIDDRGLPSCEYVRAGSQRGANVVNNLALLGLSSEEFRQELEYHNCSTKVLEFLVENMSQLPLVGDKEEPNRAAPRNSDKVVSSLELDTGFLDTPGIDVIEEKTSTGGGSCVFILGKCPVCGGEKEGCHVIEFNISTNKWGYRCFKAGCPASPDRSLQEKRANPGIKVLCKHLNCPNPNITLSRGSAVGKVSVTPVLPIVNGAMEIDKFIPSKELVSEILQNKGIHAIYAPTGTGKTEIVKTLRKEGYRVVIITPSIILCKSLAEKLGLADYQDYLNSDRVRDLQKLAQEQGVVLCLPSLVNLEKYMCGRLSEDTILVFEEVFGLANILKTSSLFSGNDTREKVVAQLRNIGGISRTILFLDAQPTASASAFIRLVVEERPVNEHKYRLTLPEAKKPTVRYLKGDTPTASFRELVLRDYDRKIVFSDSKAEMEALYTLQVREFEGTDDRALLVTADNEMEEEQQQFIKNPNQDTYKAVFASPAICTGLDISQIGINVHAFLTSTISPVGGYQQIRRVRYPKDITLLIREVSYNKEDRPDELLRQEGLKNSRSREIAFEYEGSRSLKIVPKLSKFNVFWSQCQAEENALYNEYTPVILHLLSQHYTIKEDTSSLDKEDAKATNKEVTGVKAELKVAKIKRVLSAPKIDHQEYEEIRKSNRKNTLDNQAKLTKHRLERDFLDSFEGGSRKEDDKYFTLQELVEFDLGGELEGAYTIKELLTKPKYHGELGLHLSCNWDLTKEQEKAERRLIGYKTWFGPEGIFSILGIDLRNPRKESPEGFHFVTPERLSKLTDFITQSQDFELYSYLEGTASIYNIRALWRENPLEGLAKLVKPLTLTTKKAPICYIDGLWRLWKLSVQLGIEDLLH